MAETSKAYNRRLKDGFFQKYIIGSGIDVGCGRLDTGDGADLVHPSAIAHDKDMCDAHTMDIYENNTFDYVNCSHIMEHLKNPVLAIRNWYRICKPNGHIIISIPHRDLYERRKTLPSQWNPDHKYYYLPDECDPPFTFSFRAVINHALRVFPHELVEFMVHNSCTNINDLFEHADGEFAIEAIIKKLKF